MPIDGPLTRVLTWTGVGGAGLLAVAGGLALRPPGLVAIGVGGFMAGCVAAGVARESAGHRILSTLESALEAAAGTVWALLVVAGVAVLAGGVVAVVSVAAAGTVLLIRLSRRRPVAGVSVLRPPIAPQPPGGQEFLRLPTPPPDGAQAMGRLDGIGTVRRLPPVAGLTTRQLGEEWTRTTAALAGHLDAAVRASLVQRREETLDELERRDPDGFTRWLAVGPGGDPADFVRGGPRLDGQAETDAA